MRYELKVLLPVIRFDETVQRILTSEPLLQKAPFPSHQINNLYLDTPTFRFYQEAVAGADDCFKYRLRWYGDDMEHLSHASLEKKIRKGNLCRKESLPVSNALLTDLITTEGLHRYLKEQSEGRHLFMEALRCSPVAINSYFRDYFQTPNGLIRVTIDSGVMGTELAESILPPLVPLYVPDQIIVEVKFPEGSEKEAYPILDKLGLLFQANSKYARMMKMS